MSVAPDDKSFTVAIASIDGSFAAPASMTILQAALAAGVILPSSCRNGTCRTCLCLLQTGAVSYRIEWPGLSAQEKVEGAILPCVAHAQTDLVILAPAARRA